MSILKRNTFLFLFIFTGVNAIIGQDTLAHKKYFLGFNAQYGFIAAHNPNMEYLIKRHILAGEIDLMQATYGENRWERLYKNPEKGIGFYFSYLGNPQQLGNALGLFPFVNFPLDPGRKFKLYLKVGNGIGLITKPYKRLTNHKNNINGTYINEFIYLRLNSVCCLTKKMRMETGIGLTHLSNGNWAQPNLGINLVTLNVGLTMHNYPNTNIKYKSALDTIYAKFNREPFLSVIASGGVCEINHRDGRKYTTYSLSVFEWKPVSPKSRFGIGLDFFYDNSNLARSAMGSIYYTSDTGITNIQAGIHIGYEAVVGKFAIPIEMGRYFYTKSTANGPLYHRIGLRYYINNHFILSYTLKTHWATAENIEFGIGYRL